MYKDKLGIPLKVGDTVLYPNTEWKMPSMQIGTIVEFVNSIAPNRYIATIETAYDGVVDRSLGNVINYNVVQEMLKEYHPEIFI
jgi:hypothetical protein